MCYCLIVTQAGVILGCLFCCYFSVVVGLTCAVLLGFGITVGKFWVCSRGVRFIVFLVLCFRYPLT